MENLKNLFDNNQSWAKGILKEDPKFFEKLSHQQSPEYLWIGCSDSRVPANEIVGLLPGELFVHRNVANVVVHTDLNCLSVIQYAVEVLKVKHIIVTGHYGCGGVQAAFDRKRLGLIDNWLRHVQDVVKNHESELNKLGNNDEKIKRLCELNVIEQAINVCETSIVKGAWEKGQKLSVHGWIYGLENGLLKNLDISVSNLQDLAHVSHEPQ